MQFEFSDELVEHAKRLAQEGGDPQAVMATALERLEHERREVAAVLEAIAAYDRGDHKPWGDFSTRFLSDRGITPEG